MSHWADHDIHAKLTAILGSIPSYDHHFGRPLLTAYQLAIEFADRHHAETADLGYPIGGAGTGQQNSLSQYLARELSQRIKAGTILNIEGLFLSNLHLNDVRFDTDAGVISSSLTQTAFTLSLYRLREP